MVLVINLKTVAGGRCFYPIFNERTDHALRP
jgi:hypothetical protein